MSQSRWGSSKAKAEGAAAGQLSGAHVHTNLKIVPASSPRFAAVAKNLLVLAKLSASIQNPRAHQDTVTEGSWPARPFVLVRLWAPTAASMQGAPALASKDTSPRGQSRCMFLAHALVIV